MEPPKMQEEQLVYITQRILDAVDAQYVFCFGMRIMEERSWGVFRPSGGYAQNIRTSYDLLIVVPDTYENEDHEALQKLKQLISQPASVNFIVHRRTHVTEALKCKSRFHYHVIRFGKSLHQPESGPLELPEGIATMPGPADWDRLYQQAQTFQTLGNYALSQRLHNQAMFMYHQAMEHSCTALLRFFLGLHATTHNIVQLLSITESFSNLPRTIFPGTTKEEAELTTLLSKAYSDSRYRESYEVAPGTVEVIKDRVKAFLAMAEALYKKGLKASDDPETQYLPSMKTLMK